jgi:hypothetical protein
LAACLAGLWAAGCADTTAPQGDPCEALSCAEGETCVAGRCRPVSGNNDSNNGNNNGDNNDDNNADNNDEPDAEPDADASEPDAEPDGEPDPDVSEPDPEPDPEPDLPEPDVPEPDVPEPDVPEPDVPPEGPCAEARATATRASVPVDIILFIDNSGSMNQEEDLVEDKMDDFARFISAQAIDYRVVLLSANDVCMPAPLSSGCPDTDTDLYRHVRQTINSNDGLQKVLDTYPQYQDFLRPGAKTHFIAVTDDDSDLSASRFSRAVTALTDPGVDPGFIFHSIVAYGDVPLFGCIGIYGTGAAVGEAYLSLSRATGGVTAPICQEDWDAIFRALADDVVERSVLPCQYDIPTPGGEFEQIDPEEVNVLYTPAGGAAQTLPNVLDSAACLGREWYYDDPFNPTRVILCPQACGDQDGTIDIEFGCDTVKR